MVDHLRSDIPLLVGMLGLTTVGNPIHIGVGQLLDG